MSKSYVRVCDFNDMMHSYYLARNSSQFRDQSLINYFKRNKKNKNIDIYNKMTSNIITDVTQNDTVIFQSHSTFFLITFKHC